MWTDYNLAAIIASSSAEEFEGRVQLLVAVFCSFFVYFNYFSSLFRYFLLLYREMEATEEPSEGFSNK